MKGIDAWTLDFTARKEHELRVLQLAESIYATIVTRPRDPRNIETQTPDEAMTTAAVGALRAAHIFYGIAYNSQEGA